MSATPMTWLITGASNGVGHSLARHVLEQGERVVLAARTVEAMAPLAEDHPDTALVVGLDVTGPEQRRDAVQAAESRFGAIDVLVNNAGIDFIGAVEEQAEADYRATFEVNFFGAVEMVRLVLPGMRRRGRGTIVNVSSMDGIASLPANGFYAASKFALEGLTEALWQEIEPIGLRAFLVEPGSIRTGIEHRTKPSGDAIDAYAATAGRFRATVESLVPEMFPGDPLRVAAAIHHVVHSDPGRHWVILGSDAHRRIGEKLDRLRAEYDTGVDLALSTDYPDQTATPVL